MQFEINSVSLEKMVGEMLNSGIERDFKTLYFINQFLPVMSTFGIQELEKNFENVRKAV